MGTLGAKVDWMRVSHFPGSNKCYDQGMDCAVELYCGYKSVRKRRRTSNLSSPHTHSGVAVSYVMGGIRDCRGQQVCGKDGMWSTATRGGGREGRKKSGGPLQQIVRTSPVWLCCKALYSRGPRSINARSAWAPTRHNSRESSGIRDVFIMYALRIARSKALDWLMAFSNSSGWDWIVVYAIWINMNAKSSRARRETHSSKQ